MNCSNKSSAASLAFSGAVIATCTASGCSSTSKVKKAQPYQSQPFLKVARRQGAGDWQRFQIRFGSCLCGHRSCCIESSAFVYRGTDLFASWRLRSFKLPAVPHQGPWRREVPVRLDLSLHRRQTSRVYHLRHATKVSRRSGIQGQSAAARECPAAFSRYGYDDFASCASCFDIGHGLLGRGKGKDSIHDRTDHSGIDERRDLSQLRPTRPHEQKRVVRLAAPCFRSNPVAQAMHDHSQEPWRADVSRKRGVGWA
jgi:hypothetical protein